MDKKRARREVESGSALLIIEGRVGSISTRMKSTQEL
jgi:hypothetical protein